MPKPMKVFYDSEFLEQSGTIDVISMGFVREDGKELYFVLNSFDTLAVARHDWLMKNVMTSIGHEEYTSHTTGTGTPVKDLRITDPRAVSPAQARVMILEFVADIWPEFWAWYGAYDHVALCSLFGRMVDLPRKFPMFTCDLKQLHKEAGKPDMPKQPSGHHNALDDARFNVVRYKHLRGLLDGTAAPAERRYTFVIANRPDHARAWIEISGDTTPGRDLRIITNPDQLRGVKIGSNDRVIPLTPLTEPMRFALELARKA